jgi:hypothetical protein
MTIDRRIATLADSGKSARLAAGLGAVLALHVGQGRAADWEIDPKIAVAAVYDDNIRLTEIPGAEVEVAGARVDALATVRAATQVWSFELTPRLRSTFYPDDPEQEADDQFVRLSLERQTQRTTASVNADYSKVTTLGSYFPRADVDDDDSLGDPDPGTGVGRLSVRNREERVRVTPKFGFDLSERSSLEFGARYLDVAYDRTIPGDRQDYTDTSGTVAYSFRTSGTSNLSLSAVYSQYEPDNDDATDAYGADLQWTNDQSETSQIYVRAGLDRAQVDSSTGSGNNWEDGFSGGAGVKWKFEVTSIFVDASRYLDPNSSGQLVTRDQLRAEWSRRLSPMTTLVVGARIVNDSGVGDDDTFTDRQYAAGSVGFEWRITRQWALIGVYDYAWREYDDAPTDAESNALSLGIQYEPNRKER